MLESKVLTCIRALAVLLSLAGAASAQTSDEQDSTAAAAEQSPEPSAPNFHAPPLKLQGYVLAGGTYFANNPKSPLGTLTGTGSYGLGRLLGNLEVDYKPFQSGTVTIAANAFAIASKAGANGLNADSLDFVLTESYTDVQVGAYRFVAGKRNTLRSVGYFRYPLDFYDTPSLVTTGAEDPRRIVETRNGPVMAGVERRWEWGSAGVEYLPRLGTNSLFDWHSNYQQQIISHASFVAGGAAVNVSAQRADDRDRGADSIGNPLRQASVNEYGASSTYVVGTALELHAEASFRRDQRLPSVDSHVFQFTGPLPVAAALPIWSAGADAQLVETLVGGQYTFGDRTFLNGWNVIFEYDYQSEGWTKAQWNTFFDQVGRLQRLSAAAASGAPLPLPAQQLASDFGKRTADLFRDRPAFWGRHYGFLRVSRTDLGVDGLEVAVWTIPSLQDFSFVAGANVGYEPQSGFQLRLDMRYFGGPGRSEFGRSPYRTLAQVEIGYRF
jgi:hypothetical protein